MRSRGPRTSCCHRSCFYLLVIMCIYRGIYARGPRSPGGQGALRQLCGTEGILDSGLLLIKVASVFRGVGR